MMISVWRPCGFSGTRRVDVSVPRIDQLLEAPSRYRLPTDAPDAGSAPAAPSRSRGPNMRTMIRRVKQRIAAEEYAAVERRIMGR